MLSFLQKKNRLSQTRVEDDDLEEWKKAKQLLRPKDQLELSENDLKDIIARQLATNDPLTPLNLVQFNHAVGAFELVPPPGPVVVVYSAKGTQIHKESEEAKQQVLEQGLDRKF